MRSTAARMSAARRRQSLLGGTDGLREDDVLQLWSESTAGHEIDSATEHRRELLLDVEEAEETDGPIELDEQIDVAVRPGSVARDRTKEKERPDPGRSQLLLMFSDDPQRVRFAHDRHATRAWNVWLPFSRLGLSLGDGRIFPAPPRQSGSFLNETKEVIL